MAALPTMGPAGLVYSPALRSAGQRPILRGGKEMKRRILAVLGASVLLSSGALAGTAGAANRQSAGMTTHTISLKPLGGSGVTGTAVFTYNPKAKITSVKLTVKHLKAKSVHPAHIHTGR